MYKAMVSDASEIMSAIKGKRSTGVSSVRQKLSAAMIGENGKKVEKVTKAAKELSTTKLIKKNQATRQGIKEGDEVAFIDVQRKTRGSKIPVEWKTLMTNFWVEDASHPTTDSIRNIIRKKISSTVTLEHVRHVREKSYREVYNEFIAKNPEVKVSEQHSAEINHFL